MLQDGPYMQYDCHWGVQHLLTASSYHQDELPQAWAEVCNLRAGRWLMFVGTPSLCREDQSRGSASSVDEIIHLRSNRVSH